MIVASLLVVGVFGSGLWKHTEYHGFSLWCDKDQFLTGVCTSGKWDNCKYDNNWKAQGAYCTEGNSGNFVAPGGGSSTWYAPYYKLSKYHGETIACDISRDEIGVAICSSGQYKDCRCAGTVDEGCTDRSGHSHILMCSKGISIDSMQTEEFYGDRGDDLKCSDGFVAYKFCASGAYWDCRKRDGSKTNTVLGCVKVNKVPGPGDPDKTVKKVVGYWKPLLTGAQGVEKSVSVQVSDTNTKAMSKTDTKEYGFSQGLNIEVSRGTDANYVKGGLTFEASQNVVKSVTSSTSSALMTANSYTDKVDCGNTDAKGFETLWQWVEQTELVDGSNGPLIQTKVWTCSIGTEFDTDTKPICAPGDCRDVKCRPPCKEMKTSRDVIEAPKTVEPEVKSVPKWALYGAGVIAMMTVIIGGMKAFKGSKYQAIDTEAKPETPVLAA